MADIFFSYASEDRERVSPLIELLQAQGWSVWWDRELVAGPSFDEEIEAALDAARCVVVAWSKHSLKSRWCRAEANEGLERGVLVPIRIDEVQPPLAFRSSQTASLVGWPLERGELEALFAGIRLHVGSTAVATERVDRPLEQPSVGVNICLLPLEMQCESLRQQTEVVWDDVVSLLRKVKAFRFRARTLKSGAYILRSKATQVHDTVNLRLHLDTSEATTWSARFQLTADDLANANNDVVGAVADGFITGLLYLEQQRIRELPEGQLDSLELTLLALSRNPDTTAVYASNRRLFDRALRLTPRYAFTYAAYANQLAYASQALRVIDRDRVDARRYAMKALELESVDPLTAFYCASALWHLGDADRANALIRSSYAESPLLTWSGKQKELTELGQFDEAVRLQRIADRVNPAIGINSRGPYIVYLLGGELEEAYDIELRETGRGDSYIDWVLLANVCGHMGRNTEAIKAWEKATEHAAGLNLDRWRRGWSKMYRNSEIVAALTDGLRKVGLE